ncbi:MAG TPA: hypothetical protein ENF16_00970, partial [Bacteroidetes bacterium]|nr:hypothetical protein [Bacteroidota bacterium]
MKRLINLIVLLVAGLFLFSLCELCYAQIDLRYDRRAVEQPDNVLYVGEGLRYSTIEAAVNSAESGDMIVLHPGRYTDRKINIPSGKRLKIKGDGLWSHWVVSDSAFSCAADSLTLENFQLEATGSGQLFWLT